MPKLIKLTMPPANSWLHMRRLSLAMARLLSALSRQNQTKGIGAFREKKHGEQRQEQERQEERQAARNAASEGQEPALAALVRQSGEPRHDGALSGALHELRPHTEGA